VSAVSTTGAMAGPRRSRWRPGNIILWAMFGALVAISIFPIFNVIKAAVSPPKQFYSQARSVLPDNPTFFNYKRVLGQVSREDSLAVGGSGANFNFFTAFKNSLIFVIGAAVGQIFFSTLAAYGFARLEFPGRKFLFGVILAALMVPGVVLFIPNYILIKDLGWLNTYQGQIAPFFFMTPFAVFFMRQFFLGMPRELEEAARIDGASAWTTFRKVAVPLASGPLATLAVLTIINLWNEFFWPYLVAKNDTKYPLTVALQAFKSQSPQGGIDWTGLMAGTSLGVIPVVLLVFFFGRKVIESVQFTGSK
jgi:multiple sugar transport system permease protein